MWHSAIAFSPEKLPTIPLITPLCYNVVPERKLPNITLVTPLCYIVPELKIMLFVQALYSGDWQFSWQLLQCPLVHIAKT
jgi:hypothetical protein